jgi:hypothetical protein
MTHWVKHKFVDSAALDMCGGGFLCRGGVMLCEGGAD